MLNLAHYKRNQSKNRDTNFSISGQQRYKNPLWQFAVFVAARKLVHPLVGRPGN